MNILIVHNYYKLPGGEGIVVENEKNMLLENGHNVFLYTRDNKEIDKYSLIKKIFLPINYLFNLKTYFDIRRIIMANKIDIVHVHNTINIISKSVYYAANSLNIPIVQTVHNFRLICPNGLLYRNGKYCDDCINNNLLCAIKHKCYRNSIFETILSTINFKQFREAKIFKKINFICLSNINKDKLMQINRIYKNNIIDESKIFVKPNYTDDKNIFIESNKRNNNFICASRLEDSKGIQDLLTAWKEIKDFDLLIYGVGPDEEKYKEYIKNNSLKNVFLLGQIDRNSLIDKMSMAKAVIFPTHLFESFGLTVIEAYSVGTPAIVPDFGNAGELVIDGVTGYKYTKNNIEDMRKTINKINSKKELYKNALIEYQKRYTKQNNYKQLISIYNSCIERQTKDL